MNAALFLDNLGAWSVQFALVVAAAALLAFLARLKEPKSLLIYWQLVLALGLLLPVIQPWEQPSPPPESSAMVEIAAGDTALAMAPRQVSPHEAVALALLAGAGLRLTWLGLGVARLRRLRRRARPLPGECAGGTAADIRVSDEVAGPVNFGFSCPVVLLPGDFESMPEPARRTILCHELLHVERRDWVFMVIEELIRAALWFHPATWWVLGRIHLVREQVVDGEVIARTGAREEYLETLLAAAGGEARADLAPAPLFLRKRHLARRVAAILKETTMSKQRLYCSLAAIAGMLTLTIWMAGILLPLRAPAQAPPPPAAPAAVQQFTKVTGGGDHLLHRAPVRYPPEAREKRIEGAVVLEITVDQTGKVSDARVLSGPEPLRKAALQSVLEWHYDPQSQAPATMQVVVEFRLPKELAPPPPPRKPAESPVTRSRGEILARIEFAPGVSERVREDLVRRLAVREGDELTNVAMEQIRKAAYDTDEHLAVGFRAVPGANPKEVVLRFSYPPEAQASAASIETGAERIRVGGNVQASKLVTHVRPGYPPLAKAARIQGTVRMNVLISKDGAVQDVELVSGHPLLTPAAIEAVRQWVYEPTLLNGQSVGVVTVVDVNFTLLP